MASRNSRTSVRDPRSQSITHLGSLGGGDRFIDCCLDEEARVLWAMLHSGSRGIGKRIGRASSSPGRARLWTGGRLTRPLPGIAISASARGGRAPVRRLRRAAMRGLGAGLRGVQKPPRAMMDSVLRVMRAEAGCVPAGRSGWHELSPQLLHARKPLRCVIFVTRKGAVRAGQGELGIIPGSMGTAVVDRSRDGKPG